MKKRLQGLIVGVLIGAMLTSGMVFAKQISETAELFYNNIKIYIDGGEIVPKDANGNVVEPFIYNGTTYLPVRAISNAFGKDVEWDGTTQSVYIGKKDQTKPDNYLDRIQYNDYKSASVYNDFSIINGSITDYNGEQYTNGIVYSIYTGQFDQIDGDKDEANAIISYPLNSQYSNFKGKIVIPEKIDISTWGTLEDCVAGRADILFYGDGKLLHKSTAVNSSMTHTFDINVSGVNQLVVKVKLWYEYSNRPKVALTDLALYK